MSIKRWFTALICGMILCLLIGSANAASPEQFRHEWLGEFNSFIETLDAAKNASLSGQKDLEQQYLKNAVKILDNMKMEPATALIAQDFKGIVVQNAFSRVHGTEPARLQQLYDGMSRCAEGGLYEHLHDAIVSHESRMPYYSGKTQGRSDPIFKKIATMQRLNLPVAWYIDAMARRFQQAGVPVITADLVSMKTIFPKEHAPFYHGVMTSQTMNDTRILVRDYQKAAIGSIRKSDFSRVAALTHELVVAVKKIEQQHDAHLAMTVHMLDSIGYTALHAADYQRQTNGKTDNLCRQFLMMQVFPMQECLPTDNKAQELHRLGVGVIVNDVPEIPFAKEWQTTHQPVAK